jgi:uncharacterized phage protein gp47/JayE
MYPSYEELMERKLALIDDKRDKRQGSIIFDALAPNAAETAMFYTELEFLKNRTYADTAQGNDLTMRCAERGIYRKPATKAIFLGKFVDKNGNGISIPIGSRFHLEELNYKVISPKENLGEYYVECETEGIIGNTYLGNLVPMEYIEGLAQASLIELLTDGEDEESDEELRKRYLSSFATDAFGGNIADYKRKISALDGVGGVKVYPVWNGGGTVKVVILDSGYRKATETEIQILQQKIDPQKRGMGEGIAPIGHKVTVDTVEEVFCNIQMQIILENDTDIPSIQENMKVWLEEYFLQLRKEWEESQGLVIRIRYLEARVLDIPGVVDVAGTLLNGESQNLHLQENQVPILGEIEVVV